MIKFKEDGHSYESIDSSLNIDWIGVTRFVKSFQKKFDARPTAVKACKNPKSKWYNMDPDEIVSIWARESQRSIDTGHWYHSLREAAVLAHDYYEEDGNTFKVMRSASTNGIKTANSQVLEDLHIYPEHMVYSMTDGLCGQTDRVEVINKTVNIRDYKSNKLIRNRGFKHWDGTTDKMLPPISHLDECEYVTYCLQMSLYMYMILKHNPSFIPGSMILEHIILEEEGRDKYDYPIHKKDAFGEYIVKEVKIYKLPYLKHEIKVMLNHLKENRLLVKHAIEEVS